MVNQQVLEGYWSEISAHIREKWDQISDADLHDVRGNAQQLVELIQRKTGEAREKIEGELEELVAEGVSLVSRASAKVREVAEQSGENVQQAYEQVSQQARQRLADAEHVVQQRPLESVAVAFGTGLIAGVIVGLVVRSR